MATEVRIRRGTTAQHAGFTGAAAEITVDTDKDTIVVHDGVTAGGFPLGKETVLAGKANAGANSDITSLSGLTTPLSVAQGGTAANTAAGARTALGAATAGALASSGITGAAGSGANSDITSLSGLTTPLSQPQGGSGTALAHKIIAQSLVTELTSVMSGVTTIPLDNTKPTISEGDQYLSCAFQALNASSTLEIEVLVMVSHSASTAVIAGAVFDTLSGTPTAAIGTGVTQNVNNGGVSPLMLRFRISAGSTSSRTFTFRAGSNTAGTTYVNQSSISGALYDGVLVSSIKVTEYLP